MPSPDDEKKAELTGKRPEPRKPPTASAAELEEKNAPLTPNKSLNRSTRMGAPTEDEELLKRPAPSPADFTRSDTWRVLRIMGEFVSGFDTLASLGAAVTIFGSARVTEADPMYHSAERLATLLSGA